MKLSNAITLLCILAIVAIKFGYFEPGVDPEPDVVIIDPFPGENSRLLVVYETEDVDEMPASQSLIFTSTIFREYLDEEDIEFRFLDSDVPPKSEPWRSAFDLPRGDGPWVYFSNGVNGFSKPLPGSREELQHNIDSMKVAE